MALIRPRLNDFYQLPFNQEEVDFAIPFLDEDLPLYLDPFLLWRSPSYQDNALHTSITNSFNHLGYIAKKGNENQAIDTLIKLSECYEVGLGLSRTRNGLRIGKNTAENIISLYKTIPQIRESGFIHFEEIQLFVDQVSKDRVSDIACNFLKSFLIDYTIEQAERYSVPLTKIILQDVYNYQTNKFEEETVFLPINPETQSPIMFVPKRWLRFIPWINYDDYFENFFKPEVLKGDSNFSRVAILNYNRQNYDMVQNYIKVKEKTAADCKNDPLFKPIPVISAKRKLGAILKLDTGLKDNVDKKYEDLIYQLMASLIYPNLDFATDQSRTDSGALIRDLIFYNNRSLDFLKDIYDDYGSRQIVMEIKNVKAVEREHINQLNRYLSYQFGRFGIIITRNRLSRAMFRNTVDLWSGQRKCIIALTDEDISMMVSLFESKQRSPIDVIKKKYIEFMRACPS